MKTTKDGRAEALKKDTYALIAAEWLCDQDALPPVMKATKWARLPITRTRLNGSMKKVVELAELGSYCRRHGEGQSYIQFAPGAQERLRQLIGYQAEEGAEPPETEAAPEPAPESEAEQLRQVRDWIAKIKNTTPDRVEISIRL